MKTRNFRFAETEEKSQKERKKFLREYSKKRRGEIVNRDVKEDLLIENFYRAIFGETKGAGTKRSFFIYLSFSSETPTDKLISRLRSDGHRVYCPRLEDGEMTAVEYVEELTLSEYWIREPVGEAYTGEIDVAVLPLLAVDEQGNRLGYGGGYYDRFLKKTKALRVAFCYDLQILEEVPHEEWDERVDRIVTEERILYVC